ncbi:hypothetical protein PsorP6_008617 [Peronosclerospora sorghi]|uniref:Uncharacterized protein n=1 Tax=Peronosclerospora sorghi TaxID=230839 RepID=A0ACC0WBS3_9STRA|nr:hypothetical protein PsorP6_008617 [Peronosclerospora sorghi]
MHPSTDLEARAQSYCIVQDERGHEEYPLFERENLLKFEHRVTFFMGVSAISSLCSSYLKLDVLLILIASFRTDVAPYGSNIALHVSVSPLGATILCTVVSSPLGTVSTVVSQGTGHIS